MSADAPAADQLQRLVVRLHGDLEVLSYYNLLGVGPAASDEEIRQAFYQRARLLHPDRYYSLGEGALKDQIGAVYKRVSEAYRVLGKPEQRKTYDKLMRRGALRYSDGAAERLAPREPPAAAVGPRSGPASGSKGHGIHHPQAKQFYTFGMDSLKRQEFDNAIRYFEQALAVEPQANTIRSRLDEARRLKKLYTGR
ncbi:MAG: J domain-containing protein [bacterium]